MAPRSYQPLAGEDLVNAVRPEIYYGDGPFDAPSSDSEEETLLEKPAPLPVAEGVTARKRPASIRYLAITLGLLVFLACFIGIYAAHSYTGASSSIFNVPGTRKITMDHIFNGTFSVERRSLEWVAEAGDGVFSISEDGFIKLVDLKSNTTQNLLDTQDVKDGQGNVISIDSWQLSPDMKHVLIKTDYRKQWRHSSFGNFYIHTISSKSTRSLIPPTNPPTTAYATWSPTGDTIAFVVDNDLYILPDPASSEPIRITDTGSATIFNGVPPWVYEEEVFSSDFTLWFSPNSSLLAYLIFDETEVPEYVFPIYNPTENATEVVPYTDEVRMRYPKPGYPNPIVNVRVLDVAGLIASQEATGAFDSQEAVDDFISTLDWEGRFEGDNSIVGVVTWVGDKRLIIKEVDRVADEGSVVLFDLNGTQKEMQGVITRKLGKDGEEGDDGWIEQENNIYPLTDSDGYLDVLPTEDGYNHIALFSPASSTTPIWLTSGEWEVVGGIRGVDSNGTVYFIGTYPLSTARHLYSVSLPSSADDEVALVALTLGPSDPESYFNVNFSPEAGFYLLSYEGPGIPWQRVVMAGNEDFDYTLTTNERLSNATAEYEAPTVVYSTIEIDGFELNVKEIRPPRMDDSGRIKYPVLFRVYGGPASQLVDYRFSRDWHTYLACTLNYIIVTVDGRGTGFKGRQFRNVVNQNLGFWETIDQVDAARMWAGKPYVDPRRIGIWGWSYGGFMSSKVVEADAGIHSLAMAVAPVTSWRMYDSIYTERYLSTPALNPGGYTNASVTNVTGFTDDKVSFLLAHGTGDDNVHFANSAHLVDMLTQARVRGWRFRMFVDSDHGISRRGASREIYEFLTGFLVEKWGKGGRRRGW